MVAQMKSFNRNLGGILLGCLVLVQSSSVATAADEGPWKSLFNGKDLTGWVPVHDTSFVVTNGNLRLVKGMGWLRSDKEYGDFILECEWRALVDHYDSGLFIRCQESGKPWPTDGWQVNLRDDNLGYLVRGYKAVLPARMAPVPVNQWAKFRLEVRGQTCALTVDGKKVWEFKALDRDRGFIGIQVENRAFDFRNLRILELPSAAVPAPK